MKLTRPRSLDLSNWSVDSHTSSLYTSSGSEENLSLKVGKLSRNSSTASRNGPYEASMLANGTSTVQAVPETSTPNVQHTKAKPSIKKSSKTISQADQPKRTVLTLMGGRGYVNWKQMTERSSNDKSQKSSTYASKDPNNTDAHIVLWEMKL